MAGSAPMIGQSSYDGLWWLCLAIVIGLFIGVIYFVYWLGQLPGATAAARGHPQASAITACGWLGLVFPPLWPIAFVWAFIVPAGRELDPPADLTSLRVALGATAARVAKLEQYAAKGSGR